MKTYKLVKSIVLILLFAFINYSFAQSDYEIVQGFKNDLKEISELIKNAASLDELNIAAEKINQLKSEYLTHKELLDKSIYPDKFDKSIQKLNAAYVLRQNDFATINVLQTEVKELKSQVDFLNKRNNELIAQIEDLQWQIKKDKKKLAEYENLIADLRASIKKRDRLVMGMVDSLMPPVMREKAVLTVEDKKQIYSEAEKEHILDNVKVTLRDNIRFLEVTSLEPNDIKEIRRQQEEFSDTWKIIGSKLVEVYAEEDKKTEELMEIDSLFAYWKENAVLGNVWRSLREEFEKNDILLSEFKNGEEFTSAVNLYIDDEIKSIGIKSKEESEEAFSVFADNTWFALVKPVWINYLIENKMLTDNNKSKMESKIAEWKNALYPVNWWIYVIIAVVVVAGVVIFILVRKKKLKNILKAEV